MAGFVDPSLFDRTESNGALPGFKADLFPDSIAAAYDLRSKHVHTGVPFGIWIRPRRRGNELQIGQPVVDDKEFGKTLAKGAGLSRVGTSDAA